MEEGNQMKIVLKSFIFLTLCVFLFPLNVGANTISVSVSSSSEGVSQPITTTTTVSTSSISEGFTQSTTSTSVNPSSMAEGTIQIDSDAIKKDVEMYLGATDLLKEHLRKFNDYTFNTSGVVSLGDESTYINALRAVNLVYDPSISSNAEYQPPVTNDLGQVLRPGRIVFREDISTGNVSTTMAHTLWHELTHVIENINGDDGSVYNENRDYQERNIEYMEQAVRAMDKLAQLEKSAKRGDELKDMKKYWDDFLKEFAKATQQPGPAAFPVEESKLLGWFGFKLFPEQVLKHYASGAGGDELKDMAEEVMGIAPQNGAQLANNNDLGKYTWEGQWDSNWGRMVLTQRGNIVTGHYTHDQGRIEGAVSGNQMNGTWSEYPTYAPKKDAGDVRFIMSADGKTFGGSWGYGSSLSDGDWTGSKRLTPVAPVAKFDGQNSQKKIILQINHPNISADGELLNLDSPPVLKDGRTLLPIRAITEAMGGNVAWDNQERKVTVKAKGSTVEMWLDKKTIRSNGQNKNIDVAPTIINGRTMVPVRFVADNLPDCDITWDNDTKSAVINY